MIDIDTQEIERRLNIFISDLKNTIDIPMPMMVTLTHFLPKIPAVLADEANKKTLEDFISKIAWVIGKNVEFTSESE